MQDMTSVIKPKSDQLNADDFIGGPRTYTIESVEISNGAEQPVSMRLRGEHRVWRPCKSMSRLLVAAWGPDAKAYTGKSVTLYRDPSVKWGGIEIGGIRVSHMSHIDGRMVLQLTATKGRRAPHVVDPLTVELTDAGALMAEGLQEAAQGRAALETWWKARTAAEKRALGSQGLADLKAAIPSEAPPTPEPQPATKTWRIDLGGGAGYSEVSSLQDASDALDALMASASLDERAELARANEDLIRAIGGMARGTSQ